MWALFVKIYLFISWKIYNYINVELEAVHITFYIHLAIGFVPQVSHRYGRPYIQQLRESFPMNISLSCLSISGHMLRGVTSFGNHIIWCRCLTIEIQKCFFHILHSCSREMHLAFLFIHESSSCINDAPLVLLVPILELQSSILSYFFFMFKNSMIQICKFAR